MFSVAEAGDVQRRGMLEVGDKAPSFVGAGIDGLVELAQRPAEHSVVLYFFPRAFTPG